MKLYETAHPVLALDGALTISAAEELKPRLRGAIDKDPLVLIDCSAASDIDLSFVQLLIATRLAAHGSGRRVSLAAAPAGALSDTLARAGFRPVAEGEGTPGFWFEGAAKP